VSTTFLAISLQPERQLICDFVPRTLARHALYMHHPNVGSRQPRFSRYSLRKIHAYLLLSLLKFRGVKWRQFSFDVFKSRGTHKENADLFKVYKLNFSGRSTSMRVCYLGVLMTRIRMSGMMWSTCLLSAGDLNLSVAITCSSDSGW